ncbi:MAG: CDP-alcohol phosphatidyltransferase family protein [Bacteroidia bacterium]|nr:CDP-alcohol phosphatidyltransferase family protein [Bacteroidia bacterium]HQV00826.1 CDP-alcohol phosphatidyltransferase family protein [Bacteroidia bacterium]
MNLLKHIPNALTCCNLLCGCLGIIFLFEGSLLWAAYCLPIAAVFDFFDGFVARFFKVNSAIGKDLDSLADTVTFGVLPALMLYHYFKIGMAVHGVIQPAWLPYIALLLAVFSALRLAKFNNDSRQTTSFIGVPTPAISLFIGSWPLFMQNPAMQNLNGTNAWQYLQQMDVAQPAWQNMLLHPWFLLPLTLLMCFLLVCELPLFALKFKSFTWAENKQRYMFLTGSAILLLIFKFAAIPIIITVYVLLSLVMHATAKQKS